MELGVAWTAARQTKRAMPEDVCAALDTEPQCTASALVLAVPELRTPLPGGATASQTDLWALLRSPRATISLSIEGKVRESFARPVADWLGMNPSPGKIERLQFLSDLLALPRHVIIAMRYQLLHRAAAALLEAKYWWADLAVMLVQCFAPNPNSWRNFQDFAAALGTQPTAGSLHRVRVPGLVQLYVDWVNSQPANDTLIASARV